MCFSNGGGMAEHVATQRQVTGVVMLSGTLSLDMLGGDTWATGVPAQIHCTVNDPFRNQAWIGPGDRRDRRGRRTGRGL